MTPRLIALLILLALTDNVTNDSAGSPCGDDDGGYGGLGGGGGVGSFRFLRPPPGPVFLPPVNSSTRWGDILEVTLQHALDHCKTMRLCDASGWFTPYDSQCSDCHPCSCDDACYTRGDCCVDKLLRDVRDELVLDTPPLDNPVRSCRSTYITQYDMATHVYMVDSCPVDFPITSVVEGCEALENTDGGDSGLSWPVWSSATSITYRNAHCAKCHAEDDHQLVPWDLRVQCDRGVYLGGSDQNDSFATSIIEQALKEPTCQISFSSPQGCTPFTCRAVEGQYIDACNVTGRRHSYDEALWKACEVFQGKVTVYDTYKNVFCAMCNEDTVEALGTCKEDIPFPFFVVMNGSAFPTRGRGGGGELVDAGDACGCRETEIYDIYQGTCRQLHCSMARALRYRQCQSMVTNATGLSYDVAISLVPSDPQPVLLEGKSSLKRVARNIRTAFMLQGSAASGWHVQTAFFRVVARTGEARPFPSDGGGILDVSRLTVHIRFTSMWPEPAEALESRLLALTRSQWNISVDGRPKRSFTASLLNTKIPNVMVDMFYDVSDVLTSDGFMEYAVDIPDRVIQSCDTPLLETNYHARVSPALACAKVAFNLSTTTDAGDSSVLEFDKESGSVRHLPSGKVIGFEFVEMRDDGVVLVCTDQLYDDSCGTSFGSSRLVKSGFSSDMVIVSVTFQTLTVTYLLVVFVIYSMFHELRTLSGKNAMGLVGTLFSATLLVGVGTLGVNSTVACLIVGVASHFFLLSAFVWVTICTVHAYLDLRSSVYSSPERNRSCNTIRVFIGYLSLSLVIPAVVVAITLAASHRQNEGNGSAAFRFGGYGNGVCLLSDRWSIILAAILPVLAVFVVTVILYVLAVRTLAQVSRERKEDPRQSYQRFVALGSVSLLMVIVWMMGLLAWALNVDTLWYVFVVLSGVLAVYISIVLLAKKRVLELCKTRLSASRCCRCCVRQDKYAFKPDHRFTPIET